MKADLSQTPPYYYEPQNSITGSTDGKLLRIAIAVAKFNPAISKALLWGALEALKKNGVAEKDVTVVWVPGSYELPLVAKKLAKSRNFDAVLCLGSVIKGDTAHFDYVAGECARGIADVSLTTEIPVLFGVITTYTVEQAMIRASENLSENKGYETALAAIEIANLMRKL